MLQSLNERFQGIVAWVIVSLIAITFALFGVEHYIQSHQNGDVEVEVNGKKISKHEVDLNLRRSEQFSESSQLSAEQEKLRKKQILDRMINNMVSVEAAQRLGFYVSTMEANAAILTIPQFQEDGKFSSSRYQQTLSNAFFTADSFQKEVQQGMLLNQQRFAFIGTSFALPEEVKRFVSLYMQNRDYDYLLIPTDRFKQTVSVSDQEIEAYYKANLKSFVKPEQIVIDYLRFSMSDVANKLSVSEEQMKSYYADNQSNYLKPAQWKLAHILYAVPANSSEAEQQKIKAKADAAYQKLKSNPASFDQLLVESDDKIANVDKGILPPITAGQSDFDKNLANLSQVGEISTPVKTKQGYEIFKVMAYQPASSMPFEEVKSEIKKQILADKSQTEFSKALEQLTDLSYQSPDSLATAAEALQLKIAQTAAFDRTGGTDEITKNKQVVNAAFSQDVYEFSNNSNPIQLDNNTVVVLRINKKIPAVQKSMADVRPEIKALLMNEKAKIQTKLLADAILKEKGQNEAVARLINEHQLQWQSVTNSTRDSDKVNSFINNFAFNLPKIGTEEAGAMENGDFVIVRLNKIQEGKLDSLDKEQIASIRQQLEANYGVIDFDVYLNSLMAAAKISKPGSAA